MVTHIYELNGSFADEIGGANIVGIGGLLDSNSFTFAPSVLFDSPGLILNDALDRPDEYSIELLFRIAATDGFVKLIDFKNLAVDEGLYNLSGQLNFYNVETAPNAVIEAGRDVHVVATRDGVTDEFMVYANNEVQIAFADDLDLAVFDSPSSTIQFLRDDHVTGQSEVSAGSVDYIRIFDGVLTEQDVTHLFMGGDPESLPSIPEPASSVLGLFLCLALSRWRTVAGCCSLTSGSAGKQETNDH